MFISAAGVYRFSLTYTTTWSAYLITLFYILYPYHLVIDIYGHVPEYHAARDVMGQVTGGEPETLQRILDNFAKAKLDDRIAGVILKISTNNDLGLAAMQEIRQAIQALREDDKPVFGG